MHKLLALGIV